MTKNSKTTKDSSDLRIAKESDWDDLAYIIIKLELAIDSETGAKQLKLLKNKLKIYEREKNERLFQSFDYLGFLGKEFNMIE
jgi:hypothetical protein